jgi:hypothetical protein
MKNHGVMLQYSHKLTNPHSARYAIGALATSNLCRGKIVMAIPKHNIHTPRWSGRRPSHGLTHHPIFGRWISMLQRCYNPSSRKFNNYGGRGITVCERWRESVANFYADMGDPPPGMSLERRDNNRGYSPDNCYWASPQQQIRNTRSNHILTYNGESYPITVWAEKLHIARNMVYKRLDRGWSVERALTTPPQGYARKR